MSRLNTIMQTVGMAAFERVMGDAAVYQPPTGDPVTTWAILGESSELVGEFGERIEFKKTARLPRTAVAQPLSGSTLTIGAAVYRVGQVLASDGYFATVAIKETA